MVNSFFLISSRSKCSQKNCCSSGVNRSPLFKESITLTDCSINNAMLVFMCLVCLDGYVNAL